MREGGVMFISSLITIILIAYFIGYSSGTKVILVVT
jgi:hypothetical protein